MYSTFALSTSAQFTVESSMTAIFAFLQGKKTYIVAFLGATLGLAQAIWPDIVLPEWAYVVLSAAGLGAIRAALPTKP